MIHKALIFKAIILFNYTSKNYYLNDSHLDLKPTFLQNLLFYLLKFGISFKQRLLSLHFHSTFGRGFFLTFTSSRTGCHLVSHVSNVHKGFCRNLLCFLGNLSNIQTKTLTSICAYQSRTIHIYYIKFCVCKFLTVNCRAVVLRRPRQFSPTLNIINASYSLELCYRMIEIHIDVTNKVQILFVYWKIKFFIIF